MVAVISELANLVISPSRNKLLEVLGQFSGWLRIFLHTYPSAAVMATTRTANLCPVQIVHLGHLTFFWKEKPDRGKQEVKAVLIKYQVGG